MNDLSLVTPMNGLNNAEFFSMDSDNVSDSYRIFVSKPAFLEPDKKYPVIYVLDGNMMFTMVKSILGAMTISGELPPAFIVGIGYDVTDFNGVAAKRFRDYTPSVGGDVERVLTSMYPGVEMGGGPAFLKFIQDELGPRIEAEYPVDPQDRTIVGVSLGGLLGANLLLSRPEVFQRYVLCSPSIWWNSEEIWSREAEFAEQKIDLTARVFIATGGLETVEMTKNQVNMMSQMPGPMKVLAEQMKTAYEQYGWPRMVEIMPEFVKKVRGYGNSDIHYINLPDETHMSVSPAGISRGLRYVFGAWAPE